MAEKSVMVRPDPPAAFFNAPGICRFNLGVSCTDKDQCKHCGWNAEVAKARAEKVREALR